MKPTAKDIFILESMLPHLVRGLVKRGLIKERSLKNPSRLSALFRRHIDTATKDFSVLIALHDEFTKEAFALWDRGKKLPAIVLYATAVEQLLNSHFRLSFLAQQFSNDEVTQIIRSQSLDSKLTWLLKISHRKSLPAVLTKRLRIVFEIRNSIIHYKAVPGHPDRGDDSHDAIKRRLRELGRISLRRDFYRLESFLDGLLLKSDPSFQLAHDAALILKHHWRERQKSTGTAQG